MAHVDVASSSSALLAPAPSEELEVDDGLDDPCQDEGNAAQVDDMSAALARQLHAQLNNLRPGPRR